MYAELERRGQILEETCPPVLDTIGDFECIFGWSISTLSSQTPHSETKRSGKRHDPVTVFLDLGGKTAQELAIMSHHQELIRAIEVMQKTKISISRSAAVVPDYPGTNVTTPVPGQSDLYKVGGLL
jgi:hypothetical protein